MRIRQIQNRLPDSGSGRVLRLSGLKQSRSGGRWDEAHYSLIPFRFQVPRYDTDVQLEFLGVNGYGNCE